MKYPGGHKKGYMPTWSKQVYKVTVIDKTKQGTVYIISKAQQHNLLRTYQRTELLKV